MYNLLYRCKEIKDGENGENKDDQSDWAELKKNSVEMKFFIVGVKNSVAADMAD